MEKDNFTNSRHPAASISPFDLLTIWTGALYTTLFVHLVCHTSYLTHFFGSAQLSWLLYCTVTPILFAAFIWKMMIFSFSSVTDLGFDFIGHNLITRLILRESTMWTMNRMLTGRQAGLFENVSKTSSPFDLRSTSYLTFATFFTQLQIDPKKFFTSKCIHWRKSCIELCVKFLQCLKSSYFAFQLENFTLG